MRTLCLACILAIPTAAQTYTIAGVVTDVAHGKPLERARVILAGPQSARTAVTTGADGRFSFEVPQGRYTLDAERNDWRLHFGHPEPAVGMGSAIITGVGKDTAHLAFRWYAPGAVFGKVVDEQGEPARDATVWLIRDAVREGRRRLLPVTTVKTDDNGEYRFGPVGAGTFYVVAAGRPWYEMRAAMPVTSDSRPPASAYPATYYPGTTDSRNAATVTVPSGGEMRADIRLRATIGTTVKIRCPGSGIRNDACQGQPMFLFHAIGGIELPTEQEFDYATQSFVGVAPGPYTVRSAASGAAFKVVDIGNGEFTFDLVRAASAMIKGDVTFRNPLPPGSQEYLGLETEVSGGRRGFLIAPNGAFSFYVGGSSVRPQVFGSIPEFIAEMSVDGTPIKDGIVDATQNTEIHLKILASDEMGRLKGFALANDHPAPAVLVVLAPAADSPNPADYHGFQTESDGSFDYLAIPAGDYLLFAVDKLDLEYTNPAVIRPYLAGAVPVHIAAHATAEQRVNVVISPRP